MIMVLFFILSFLSYAFAAEPTIKVAQQRCSNLLNVRMALANRVTPRQYQILIPCLTITTRTACGLLFGYVVRRCKESLVTDSTDTLDYDCFVDLGDMCVDTCNNLVSICYAP